MAIWSQFNDVDCRKCNKQIKEARGCEGLKKPIIIEGYEVSECPVKHISAETIFYILGYQNYEKGVLPNAGGWLDQPMKFLQMMLLIARVMSKFEEERQCRNKQ